MGREGNRRHNKHGGGGDEDGGGDGNGSGIEQGGGGSSVRLSGVEIPSMAFGSLLVCLQSKFRLLYISSMLEWQEKGGTDLG